MEQPTRKRRRKLPKILAAAAVLLLAVRVYLPYGIESVSNRALAKLADYEGSIGDVDLALWRGAYRFQDVRFEKTGGGGARGSATIETVDISLDWGALLRGAIAGEVAIVRPVLDIVAVESDQPQEESDSSLAQTLTDLVAFEINRFEISEGALYFRGAPDAPLPELTVQPIDLVATNLTNAADESRPLPSTVNAQAGLQGGALARLSGGFNLLKEPAEMDMELACEGIQLVDLNPVLRRYAALDAESGELGVYSEWAVADGAIDGYLKFVARELEILDVEEDGGNPISALWEAIVEMFVSITENEPRDQFATRIPFGGRIEDLDTGILAAIGSLLRNGFVQAMTRDVDGTITLGSAEAESEKQERKE